MSCTNLIWELLCTNAQFPCSDPFSYWNRSSNLCCTLKLASKEKVFSMAVLGRLTPLIDIATASDIQSLPSQWIFKRVSCSIEFTVWYFALEYVPTHLSAPLVAEVKTFVWNLSIFLKWEGYFSESNNPDTLIGLEGLAFLSIKMPWLSNWVRNLIM